MSVFIDSKKSLLDYLNATNGTTMFTLENLVFSNPAPVAGTWREEVTQKNTFMKVNASETAGFKGRAVVTYDRLQLANFANYKPAAILPAWEPTTTHDLLANVLYYFGLFLSPADIEDDPVVLDENGAGAVVLRAKTTSPLWLGELTVNVIEGGANIADMMTVQSLDGLNYPVADPSTQVSALLYVYPFDATEWRDQLLDIADGAPLAIEDAQLLATIFSTLDAGIGQALWNATPADTAWALEGATVVYSGLNSLAFPTNQSYKYVLGLELRGDVTIPSGRFYLHYNDPDDPDSAE